MTGTRHTIGIDVGGTKIAAALVDVDHGAIVRQSVEPTNAHLGGEAVLGTCVRLLRDLHVEADALGFTVAGTGIGVAEMVDCGGAITTCDTIAWRGFDLPARLAEFGPVRVDSDVRAAALAEARFGAGTEATSFLYVTIGTGISACLVIDGQPYAGAHGNAIAFASSPAGFVDATGEKAASLEAFASGPALLRRFRESGGTARDGKQLLALANDGNPLAQRVVETVAKAVAAALGILVNALDPEQVIVGGGLGTAPGLYWKTLVAATRAHIYAAATKDLPLLQSEHGDATGALGAALLPFCASD